MQRASIYFDALLSIQNPHIICNNTHIGAYVMHGLVNSRSVIASLFIIM